MDVEGAEILGELRDQTAVACRAKKVPACTLGHDLARRQLDLVVSWLGVESGEEASTFALGSQDHPILRIERRLAVGTRVNPVHYFLSKIITN
jgi:hypothetical protein